MVPCTWKVRLVVPEQLWDKIVTKNLMLPIQMSSLEQILHNFQM